MYYMANTAKGFRVDMPEEIAKTKYPDGVEMSFEVRNGELQCKLLNSKRGLKGSFKDGVRTYALCTKISNSVPLFGKMQAEDVSGESEVICLSVVTKNMKLPINRGGYKSLKVVKKPATPKFSLREAVAVINAVKNEMGDELILEINSEGRLRALVEYS